MLLNTIVRGALTPVKDYDLFYVVAYNHTLFCNMFHILAFCFLKYDLARANLKVHQVALAFVGCEIIFLGFRHDWKHHKFKPSQG